MTFLPIVQRELRVASRAGSTYFTRFLAGGLGVSVAGWMLLTLPRLAAPSAVSGALLQTLSLGAFVYALLIGVRNTADCLSRERREGTLGLLFLTDLRGWDIVLGKLAATSLHALYGLVALLPVLAIPLVLGGLQASQVARTALVLLNTLLFSLACGLFVSTLCENDRRAVGGALALLLMITAGLPLAGVFVGQHGPPPRTTPAPFLWPSPGFTLAQANTGGAGFWRSLLLVHGLSWAMIAAASLLLRRVWHDQAAGSGVWRRTLSRLAAWRAAHFNGGTPARRAWRARWLDDNPCYWLFARKRRTVGLVWGFLAAAAMAWSWGYGKLGEEWQDNAIFVLTALVLHSVLKVWIASEAGAALVQDRVSGALELLLCTGVGPREIVRGRGQVLLRQFGLPILVVLVVDGVFLLKDAHDAQWVALWSAGMAMLGIDAVTLHFVGTWASLTAPRATRAINATVARVLVLPWLIFCVLVVSMTALRMTPWAPPSQVLSFQHLVLLWFGIGLVNNAVFGGLAWYNLHTRFREAAAERYTGRVQKARRRRPDQSPAHAALAPAVVPEAGKQR
jgi:ABC-type transport system involved in multi-copper enzyme maturation permease subunit